MPISFHKPYTEYYFARRSSTFPSICDRLGGCSPEYHFCRSGMTCTSSIVERVITLGLGCLSRFKEARGAATFRGTYHRKYCQGKLYSLCNFHISKLTKFLQKDWTELLSSDYRHSSRICFIFYPLFLFLRRPREEIF